MYSLWKSERIEERLKQGELKKLVRTSKVVSDETARGIGLQPGSRSETVAYVEGLTKIVLVHRYLQPDGTIGASGKEDPMWLRTADRIYIRKKKRRKVRLPSRRAR